MKILVVCFFPFAYIIDLCFACARCPRSLTSSNPLLSDTSSKGHTPLVFTPDYLRADKKPESVKKMMLSSIRWYRETLSPIMPPNCRFQPSCSNYAIQAIEEFGSLNGGILIAWRIFRCNPLGPYGFDPPQWPPPSYFRTNYNPPML